MQDTMQRTTFPFTATSVRELCLPPDDGRKQILYWHDSDDLRGFGMRVGEGGKKAWIAQADKPKAAGGKTCRVTLGSYPEMAIDKARKKAAKALSDIREGKDPVDAKRIAAAQHAAEAWAGETWADAVALKVAQLEAKAEEEWSNRVKAGVVAERGEVRDKRYKKREWHYKVKARLERHTAHWLADGKRLIDISIADCNELFDAMCAKGVRGEAKKVLKHVREVWNAVRENYIDGDGNFTMPESPINRMPETRRKKNKIDEIIRVGQPVQNLRQWYADVMKIKNPARRDLQLFMLFTGLRSSEEAKVVRWDDLKSDNVLHIPAPKGGVGRATDIPLSDFVVKLLAQRKANNATRCKRYGGDGGWVFPRKGERGNPSHVSDPSIDGLPSPHRLRDTFAEAGSQVGMSEGVIGALMNHAPGRGTTRGYQQPRPPMNVLRKAAEAISQHLQVEMGLAAPKPDENAALVEQVAKLTEEVTRLRQQQAA